MPKSVIWDLVIDIPVDLSQAVNTGSVSAGKSPKVIKLALLV